MKNFFKNLCLFVVVLILSYLAAPYFGKIYDHFSPQYDGSFIGLSKEITVLIAGIPLSYMFFVPLVFGLFGFGNKKWLVSLLLLPIIVFYILADAYHIYVPITTGLIGLILTWLIHLTISKFRHPNPPMVIK